MAVTLNIGFLMICIIAAEMSRAADSDILFPTCVCVTVMEWIKREPMSVAPRFACPTLTSV